MRAKKVDLTHGEIKNALTKAGVVLHDTSMVGGGFPDFACSYRGYCALVEAKTGSRAINERQSKFHDNWQGAVIVARSGEEAVSKFFGAWKQDRLSKAI